MVVSSSRKLQFSKFNGILGKLMKNQPPLADPVVSFAGFFRKTARGSIELEIGRTPADVLREEETEKQELASGIALGSPCFSGDYFLQRFSERTI
jgi:hypothetical protein